MKITVCVGSSCHLKGAKQIIGKLQALTAQHGVGEAVELTGDFCMGNCESGVSVKIDGELFSLKPDSAEIFFTSQVLPRIE